MDLLVKFEQATLVVLLGQCWLLVAATLWAIRRRWLRRRREPVETRQFLDLFQSARTGQELFFAVNLFKGTPAARIEPGRFLLTAAEGLLAPRRDWNAVESQLAAYAESLDDGARRLLGFLAKTAPQAGLAGTLIGVSRSLVEFRPGELDSFLHGFAFAFGTTLLGVAMSVISSALARFLWQAEVDARFLSLQQTACRLLHADDLLPEPLALRSPCDVPSPRRTR